MKCGLARVEESGDSKNKFLTLDPDIYTASFMSMITEMDRLPPMPLEELPQ
jgi:hypothetical protein